MVEMSIAAKAAAAIRAADALLITAGAGMGVDSGLPDFRGKEGFWRAYPPMKHLKLEFHQMSTPKWFEERPRFAWGFFGHRADLYKSATPHAGFHILKTWAEKMPSGHFIFTSNVDNQFQKAGFDEDKIYECHGSLSYLQCFNTCSEIFEFTQPIPPVDKETFEVPEEHPLPSCPSCGGLARPNVLMFGDYGWLSDRSDKQEQRYRCFLNSVANKKLVVIEMGAGKGVPTVRVNSERAVSTIPHGTLIRINPVESDMPRLPRQDSHISYQTGALQALTEIQAELTKLKD